MVDVGEIVEHSQVDGEDADLGAAESENWHDGGDGREGCPAEPEETDGQQSAFDAGEVQSPFWRLSHLPTPGRALREFLLVDAQDRADECAD